MEQLEDAPNPARPLAALNPINPADYPDPTERDLDDLWFEAIWQAIKGWDMSREANGLYCGATGNDVCHILRAIQPLREAATHAADR
jgi:hypothetical protein